MLLFLKRLTIGVLLLALLSLFVLNIAFFWLILPTNRTLATWIEPVVHDVKYGVKYELVIKERERRVSYLLYKRAIELQIHRVKNTAYYHAVPAELYGEAVKYECKNNTCFVKWTNDGVEFSQASGHKLFIPAKAYQGGR